MKKSAIAEIIIPATGNTGIIYKEEFITEKTGNASLSMYEYSPAPKIINTIIIEAKPIISEIQELKNNFFL